MGLFSSLIAGPSPGITIIAAAGMGKVVSFDRVIPTIVEKKVAVMTTDNAAVLSGSETDSRAPSPTREAAALYAVPRLGSAPGAPASSSPSCGMRDCCPPRPPRSSSHPTRRSAGCRRSWSWAAGPLADDAAVTFHQHTDHDHDPEPEPVSEDSGTPRADRLVAAGRVSGGSRRPTTSRCSPCSSVA